MSAPEQYVSKNLIRSSVPLGKLTEEQLDLLIEKSELVHLYKGQNVVRAGDTAFNHIYLIHGTLTLINPEGEISEVQAGDAASYQPIAHEFPRRLSVAASTDCSILKVDSDFLEKLICWGQVARCLLAEIAVDKQYHEDFFWIKKLLQSKLFFKVPPTNIRNVLNKFLDVSVFEGNRVITEGEEGTCCYLIKSGEAEVYVKAAGKEPVAVLGPGTVVGEDALVTNNPRNASIVMKNDGVLMKLEKRDFYQLLTTPAVTMVTPGNVDGFLNTGAVLLDVRTQEEYDLGHHAKAINVPLNLVYLKSSVLDKETLYITYSPTEERAKAAAYLLTQQGFQAYALQSGVNMLPRELAQAYSAG